MQLSVAQILAQNLTRKLVLQLSALLVPKILKFLSFAIASVGIWTKRVRNFAPQSGSFSGSQTWLVFWLAKVAAAAAQAAASGLSWR